MIRRATALILVALMMLCAGCSPRYTEENRPVVTMTLADGSQIVMELYPDKAPNTVANFVTLAQSGFYDGLTFHRSVPGFIVQGGDPNGDGTGGPGYAIAGEFLTNDYRYNSLTHTRGTVSMARGQDNDSAGSQFFIVLSDDKGVQLNGKYASFGRVISGMEAVDAIAQGQTDGEMLLEPVVIRSVTVDTKGLNYRVKKIR